jgi:hypothetical protein
MTITQALALRPGQRVTDISPTAGRKGDHAATGRVISNGRRVVILWDDNWESHLSHRYMYYVHVLAETITTRETV